MDDDDRSCDALDMMEEDELEYIKKNFGCGNRNYRPQPGTKRKAIQEEIYEKIPRNSSGNNKRSLLPLKGKEGLILREAEVEDEAVGDSPSEKDNCREPSTPTSQSLIQTLAQRQKLKRELKTKIGVCSSSVIENPQENINYLKDLTILLSGPDPSCQLTITRLATLSLLEIYKDILPSYRIRSLSSQEKSQKMKKETRKLNQYEESLLRYYKQYLMFLEKCVRSAIGQKIPERNFYTERKRKMGVLAVRCLSELLVTHPNFNFSANIVDALVPLMAEADQEILETCCRAVRSVFREDKLGQISLTIVKRMVQLIKSRQERVSPEALRTFLELRVTETEPENCGQKNRTRDGLAKLSRRERKRAKKVKELENELRETRAEENRTERARLSSEILKRVFLIYFRIVKSGVRSKLLTPVLEGLSKLAHLINVEFFHDLIDQLYTLPDRVPLTHQQILHCLHTVFAVLSGQGSALNIDPQRFFNRLYQALLRVGMENDDRDFDILLKCLDVMVIKRRQLNTRQRTLAFIKRLCTVALQNSGHGVVALLSIVRCLMISDRRNDVLLETEESGGSGIFLPELEDPEHCQAQASTLWELNYLVRHYHPVVRRYARHLLNGCPWKGVGSLDPEIAKAKAPELYRDYRNYSWPEKKR